MIGAVLFGTSAAGLAGTLALRRLIPPIEGAEPLAYFAGAFAVLSPALAAAARGEGLVSAGLPSDPAAARPRLGRHLVFFAILESAALLCAVAALLTPSAWPLLAGVVPLAVMAVNVVSSGA